MRSASVVRRSYNQPPASSVHRHERGGWPPSPQVQKQALRVARQLDDQRLEAQVLRGLGDLHCLQADHDQAVGYLHESVAIWRRLEMPLELATTLQRLGQAALDAGSPRDAQSAWREALAPFDQMGAPEARQVAAPLDRRLKTSSGT